MKNLIKLPVYVFALVAIFFVFSFINFNNNVALADATQITSFTLDSASQEVKFNPQNGDKLSINIELSAPVKVTRVYICSLAQVCNGSKGNYTRYFSPSATTSSISESWDGKVSSASDAVLALEGEYRVMISFYENGASTASNLFGEYAIFSDFSYITSGGGTGTTTATTTDETATSTATSTATTTATTTTVGTNGGVIVVYSAHYIQEDLSSYVEPTVFQVSAGRERLSYLNSLINFEAKFKKSGDVSGRNCIYTWNFGDGSSLLGEKVEHIYKYVGDYNVVLNGSCGDLKSVSRTAVKVLESNLSMNQKNDGAIEIANQGKYEINLYGYKIQSGSLNYAFPLDTIISANKSVIFPAEYLNISTSTGGEIALVDSSGKTLASTSSNFTVYNLDKIISEADFTRFALEYKKIIQTEQIKQPVSIAVVTPKILPVSPVTVVDSKNLVDVESNIPLTAAVVLTDNPSFWSKIFYPIRSIKDAFYK